MPIYEYKCSACGHQEEFLQKVSDPPQTRCSACGQETFSKMLTAAGFQLKGSGWYATDFKGAGSKPAAKSEGKSGDGGSATATPESASKPEGAASSKTEAAGTKTEASATPAKPSTASGSGPSSA